MKRYNLLLSFIIVFLSLMFFGCGSNPSSNNDPGTVEGRVRDYPNGNYLDNIQISDGENLLATSNSSGEFSFQIEKGTYDFHFNGNGYITYIEQSVKVKAGNTTEIDIPLVKIDVFEISTDISPNGATWNNDRIYHINEDIIILGPLTITEGTIIKFRDGKGWVVDGESGGEIIAIGTGLEPIIFTSWHDDVPGGDSNGNQNATSPDRGDWENIKINGAENNSVFDYCKLYYGGSEEDCVLFVDYGANVSITNCVLSLNKGSDGALNASFAGSETIIQNNTFFSNVWPLNINMTISLDGTNIFMNPQNRSYGNDYDGILVNNTILNGSINWSENEIAFVLNEDDYIIPAGNSLTIGPGVVVKMMDDVSWQVDGTLTINGTETAPVNITSYTDDEVWGDTNGDGSATQPEVGDWNFIKIIGVNNDSSIEYCNFYYGGGDVSNDYTLCVGSGTDVSILHCNFVNNIGLNTASLDAGDAGAGTVIRYNNFYLNQKPLQINGLFNLDASNEFRNPDNYTQDNIYNGIFVDSPGSICEIEGDIIWAENEYGVTFVALYEGINISEQNSLTLAENVILKFLDCSLDHFDDNLLNYNASGVYYTSYHDDEHGDDTNGSTTPAADGDWLGIRDTSTALNTWENWGNILYSEY
jgi:Carboxypeptidase regulatory-like domain